MNVPLSLLSGPLSRPCWKQLEKASYVWAPSCPAVEPWHRRWPCESFQSGWVSALCTQHCLQVIYSHTYYSEWIKLTLNCWHLTAILVLIGTKIHLKFGWIPLHYGSELYYYKYDHISGKVQYCKSHGVISIHTILFLVLILVEGWLPSPSSEW